MLLDFRSALRLISVFWLAGVVFAEEPPRPVLAPYGVSNGASYSRAFVHDGSVFGSLARGGIFVVRGAWLGPEELALASAPYPTELAEATIEIRSVDSGETFSAYMIHAWEFHLAGILPSAVPSGTVEMTVVYQGRRSDPILVPVSDFQPGLFTLSQDGRGPAVAQNWLSPAEQPLNGLTAPVRPGQYLILWGTGLGPIAGPDNADPPVGTIHDDLVVRIGGNLEIKPSYAGRAPGLPGVDQINVQIPDDPSLVTGCYVELGIKGGASSFGLGATVAIEREGDACNHPWGLSYEKLTLLEEGGRLPIGQLFLTDLAPDSEHEAVSDIVHAWITIADRFGVAQMSPRQFAPLSDEDPVPLRQCGSAGALRALVGSPSPLPQPPRPPNGPLITADAGEIVELIGPGGRRAELSAAPEPTWAPGAYDLTEPPGPDFFTPGAWTLQSFGGEDIGAFSADVRIPPSIEINPPPSVQRGADLTFTWPAEGYEPADTVSFFIAAEYADEEQPGVTHSEGVYCTVEAVAGELTIPRGLIDKIPEPTDGRVSLWVDLHSYGPLDTPAFDYSGSAYHAHRSWEIPID